MASGGDSELFARGSGFGVVDADGASHHLLPVVEDKLIHRVRIVELYEPATLELLSLPIGQPPDVLHPVATVLGKVVDVILADVERQVTDKHCGASFGFLGQGS